MSYHKQNFHRKLARYSGSSAAFTLAMFLPIHGQISSGKIGGRTLNTIKTSVAFLTVSPDARAGGMGDLGVAGTPDVYSQHWNIAKYPFSGERMGMGLTYTP